MLIRPPQMGAYEFVVVASLRAHQLMAGSVARVPSIGQKATMTAQREVRDGLVAREGAPGVAGTATSDELSAAGLGDAIQDGTPTT
ncbi:MAG: DNA-directed RNA polymerase subunit omega [Vicinamibacterales bacterium]